MNKSWAQVGRELAAKLEGMDDEAEILALGSQTIQRICKAERDPKKRKNALASISRSILRSFPRLEAEAPLYWRDERGQQGQPKYRHLVYKTLTLEESDWDAVGGEQKRGWKATLAQQEQVNSTQPELTQSQPMGDTSGGGGGTLSLQLDSETQQLFDTALAATGMEPMELIRRAVSSYAKAIVSKRAVDLETIPTRSLLEDSSYSTIPGRAEELTKRAIRAIMRHNSEIATENNQRWAITQSIIAALIGGRPSSIGKAMKPYQGDIDDHNAKYGLNGYTNRSQQQKINEVIDLAALVR